MVEIEKGVISSGKRVSKLVLAKQDKIREWEGIVFSS
jgi:hypothetical protein